ncbi:MAG TPA: zinc-ribbon domain-containing protein, partial [Anaeromyxobacteraceae bacterium]|nr:zinc-ribbon domain-containing protein [Anaeromyxobacteraceae bacterium]
MQRGGDPGEAGAEDEEVGVRHGRSPKKGPQPITVYAPGSASPRSRRRAARPPLRDPCWRRTVGDSVSPTLGIFPLRVACPNCRAEYAIDERRVPPGGLAVRCPKCQGAFPVKPPADGAGAVPLPGAPARAAAPPTPPRAPAGATLQFERPPALASPAPPPPPAPAARPPPPPAPAPRTTLAFGEVDLGPAPSLGHADEPFPFDTPEPEARPRRDTGVPLPADPFGAASPPQQPAPPEDD